MPTGAGLRPGAKAPEEPPDPTGGAPALDPTDERRLETEPRRGVRHRHRRKPPGTATPSAYRHRASRRLYPPPANNPGRTDIETVLAAASDLDWSEIDPSILGTLFERGLDPDKRAQLGAHYTARDKIMLLVATTTRPSASCTAGFTELWSLRLCTWLGKGNDPRPQWLADAHAALDAAVAAAYGWPVDIGGDRAATLIIPVRCEPPGALQVVAVPVEWLERTRTSPEFQSRELQSPPDVVELRPHAPGSSIRTSPTRVPPANR